MGLKTVLTTLINNNIRNKTPKVIKTEHADVEQAIVDELYKAKVTDSNSTETYTTKNGTVVTYNITSIKKIGTYIRVDGSYTNTGISILPAGTVVFTFKDNEYKGDTSYYLGINCYYEPYAIKMLDPVNGGQTKTFTIQINPNTI